MSINTHYALLCTCFDSLVIELKHLERENT